MPFNEAFVKIIIVMESSHTSFERQRNLCKKGQTIYPGGTVASNQESWHNF